MVDKITRFNAKFDTLFFERYAKLTLVDKLGAAYAGLVNADRPDLQDVDRGLGIEVTRAIAEDKNVANALINEMAGKRVTDVASEVVDALEVDRSGYAYGLQGHMVGAREYDYWRLALPMRRIVTSKVRKVGNGFYGCFREFGLYIFTHVDLENLDIHALMLFTVELQRSNRLRYHKLYVSQIQKLYVCDLEELQVQSYAISQADSREYYRKAFYNIN